MDEEDVHCPLCYQVFLQPVATPCGHEFCELCIQKWLDCCAHMCGGRPAACPICRRPVVETALRPAAELAKAIAAQLPAAHAARLAAMRPEIEQHRAARAAAAAAAADTSALDGAAPGGGGWMPWNLAMSFKEAVTRVMSDRHYYLLDNCSMAAARRSESVASSATSFGSVLYGRGAAGAEAEADDASSGAAPGAWLPQAVH